MNQKQIIRIIRRKLTFVCAIITISILIVMSLSYLYISERSLKDNQFLSFQNSVATFLSNLEQQTVISHDWLVQTESNGTFYIELKDNGEDFLFNSRNSDALRKELFFSANSYYETHFDSPILPSNFHQEYSFFNSSTEYFASSGTLNKDGGLLSFTIVYPLHSLHTQIANQRILFCIIDGVTILLLGIFSFYFTGKVLKPLIENQNKQTQFIASVSHELRTPLAVILSCASACKKADDKEKNNFLQTILSEGIRMSRLIQDMLALAKSDNHTFTIDKTPCEPVTLLLNSYEAFEIMAKEKDLQFTVSLPDEMCISCLLDKERISQVLSIIIHNAINYTPAKGVVRLCMEQTEKYVIFQVSDTGLGIPDSEKEKIFERFYRINQSRSEKEHFGLGLCIALEIVQAHHGKITVSDTPDGGSTFKIILPIS